MTCAVVLICDTNFILPSFATAISARANIALDGVPVIIFVTDATEASLASLRPAAQSRDIELTPAQIPEIEAFKSSHRDRFLPVATLSRFWVDRLLPSNISRFLYLDGDILINLSIDELLMAPIPENGILTAPDTVALCAGEVGPGPRREKTYLDGLGSTFDSYFNAGVLLADRSGWRAIADNAMQFLRDHPEKCRSSDQSALNAVTKGKRGMLSQRWNYQSDHMTVLDPRTIGVEPAIYHFTGGPKPWHQATWPWDESFNWAYRDALKVLEGLGVADPKPSPAQLAEGLAHRARAWSRLKYYFPWRRITRGRRIRQLLAQGAGGVSLAAGVNKAA
ncbi:MAG: glycosyltransferase family 8 protein [Chitinophagales bacterium]|nr:glycosyltransferase family 8 protein [Hyphomicrobiales bacterium]